MKPDDFQKSDEEATVFSDVAKTTENRMSATKPTVDIIEYRRQLVEKYHGGSSGFLDKLKMDGTEDIDAVLMSVLQEVIKESDHLLGNELLATSDGMLRDASVMSFKRTEILEKVIKAIQTKQQVDKQSGIDVDSPSMMIVFRYFLSKVKKTFDKIGMPDEQNNLFFRSFGDETTNWKKELRENFNEMRKTQESKQ
jgi:hypothetical protein